MTEHVHRYEVGWDGCNDVPVAFCQCCDCDNKLTEEEILRRIHLEPLARELAELLLEARRHEFRMEPADPKLDHKMNQAVRKACVAGLLPKGSENG